MFIDETIYTAPPSPVDSLAESIIYSTTDTISDTSTDPTIPSVVQWIKDDSVGASIPLTVEISMDATTTQTVKTTNTHVQKLIVKKRKHPTIQYRRTFKEPFKFPRLRALTPDSDEFETV